MRLGRGASARRCVEEPATPVPGPDRIRLAATLAQPLLYLVIFGTGLASSLGTGFAGGAGVNYTQFTYPGIVSMSVLFTSIFSAMDGRHGPEPLFLTRSTDTT